MNSESKSQVQNGSGVGSWLVGGRRGLEGYIYLAHRISGLILLLFLISHILLASARLISFEAWAGLMRIATSPEIVLLKYPLFIAFAFHAINGIRLILIELGFAVGAAEQQVYPYRGSIHKQRPLLIAMMILTAVLLVAGGFEVLRLSH